MSSMIKMLAASTLLFALLAGSACESTITTACRELAEKHCGRCFGCQLQALEPGQTVPPEDLCALPRPNRDEADMGSDPADDMSDSQDMGPDYQPLQPRRLAQEDCEAILIDRCEGQAPLLDDFEARVEDCDVAVSRDTCGDLYERYALEKSPIVPTCRFLF